MSHHFPLEEGPEAFRIAADANSGKVCFRFESRVAVDVAPMADLHHLDDLLGISPAFNWAGNASW